MTKFHKIRAVCVVAAFVFVCVADTTHALITSKNSLNNTAKNLAANSSELSETDSNGYLQSIANTQLILNKKKEIYRTSSEDIKNIFDSSSGSIDTVIKKLKDESEAFLFDVGSQLIEEALLNAVKSASNDPDLIILNNTAISWDNINKIEAIHNIIEKYGTGRKNLLDSASTEELKDAVIKYSAGATARYVASKSNEITTIINMKLPDINARLDSIEDHFEKKLDKVVENVLTQNNIVKNLETLFQDFDTKYDDFAEDVTDVVGDVNKTVNEAHNTVNKVGKVVVQADRILTEFGEIFGFDGELKGYHREVFDQIEGVFVDLDKEMGRISDDVGFYSAIVYDVLMTKDKIKAIVNPAFLEKAFNNEYDRAKAKAKGELQEIKRDIASEINKYAGTIKDIAAIAGALGIVSGKDQKKINQVVEYASVAANICGSFASGNYVGMAVSIVGLFGGGGSSSSPEQQQFEAVMGMLRQIDAKLDVIDKKIDNVIELQKTTLEAIAELGDLINNNSRSIQEELTHIQWELQTIKGLVIDTSTLHGRLTDCSWFLITRNYYNVIKDQTVPAFLNDTEKGGYGVGYFDTWENLAAHYNDSDNYSRCSECIRGLDVLFVPNTTPNKILLMESYSTENGAAGLNADFIDPTYKPALAIFKNNYGDSANSFYGLGNPSYNYDDLSQKVYKYKGSSYTYNKMSDIEKLIHPEVLQYYTYIMLQLLMYKDIVNDRGLTLKPLEDILSVDNYSPTNIVLRINSALQLTNLAIAQQSLLNGDAAIPLIHKKLFSKTISQEMRNHTIQALQKNSYLAHNYLISQLTMEMTYAGRKTGDFESYQNRFEKNLEIYKAIFNGTEAASSFDSIFTTNWSSYSKDVDASDASGDPEFTTAKNIKTSITGNSANGYYIVLDNNLTGLDNITASLHLPDPSSLEKKTYAYREELKQLVTLRDKLLSYAISNYESVTLNDLYHLFGNDPSTNTFAPIPLISDSYFLKDGEELDVPLKYYDIEGNTVTTDIDSQTVGNTAFIENAILKYKADTGYIGEDIVSLLFNDGKNQTKMDIKFTTAEVKSEPVYDAYKVLTDSSSDYTILSGANTKVYGSAGVNTIIVESGAKVECINFVGSNLITIKESKSQFTIKRSGATVYLNNASTGTQIKIPATQTQQILKFTDGTYTLSIKAGKVMLGTQEVTI